MKHIGFLHDAVLYEQYSEEGSAS